MSMTDPIADFLARIRNAILARHARGARCRRPSSSSASPRSSRTRASSPAATCATTTGMPEHRRRACAGPTRAPTPSPGMRRVLASGPARVRPPRHDPQGPLRPRHRDPLDVEGRDDRPRGAQGGRRRRAPLRGLVRSRHVAHRTKSSAAAQGRDASRRSTGSVSVKGPKGELTKRASRRASRIKIEARQAHGRCARTTRARTAPSTA